MAMVGDLDLLVAGGTVVTMDEERRLLPSGYEYAHDFTGCPVHV